MAIGHGTATTRESMRVIGAWLSFAALAAACVVIILMSKQGASRVSDAEFDLETFSMSKKTNSSAQSQSSSNDAANLSSVQASHQRELEIASVTASHQHIAKLKREAATDAGQPRTEAIEKKAKKLVAMLGSTAGAPQGNKMAAVKDHKNLMETTDVPESISEKAEWHRQEFRTITRNAGDMELALDSQQQHHCRIPWIAPLEQPAACHAIQRLGGTCSESDAYVQHEDASLVLSVQTVIPANSQDRSRRARAPGEFPGSEW